eukprot:8958268-Pyramimonas_sp.AAC.5
MAAKRDNAGASSMESWKEAVIKRPMHSSTRTVHPTDALLPVLLRFAAWKGCTTSGIEQMLSKVNTWLLTPRRKTLNLSRTEDEMFLVCEDLVAYNMDRVYKDADAIYKKCFGLPRARGKSSLGSFGKSFRKE